MDVSLPQGRGRAVGILLAVAGVLVVTGLVAVASSEDVPAGTTRRPGDRMLDLLYSFGIVTVALALIGGAILYALAWQIRLRHGRSEGPASPLRAFVILVLVLLPLVGLAYLRRGNLGFADAEVGGGARVPDATETATPPAGYEPEFATGPVLIAAAAALAALLAVWMAHRSRRRALRPRAKTPVPPSLDEVLADTVDDLRSEPDPRRAVIAAYARLERALAAAGHPRARSDAPGEYLGRVLREAEVSPAAVARLTTLFAQAKFSQHQVGEEMRIEAIDALEEVREGLRAAELVREALVPA